MKQKTISYGMTLITDKVTGQRARVAGLTRKQKVREIPSLQMGDLVLKLMLFSY